MTPELEKKYQMKIFPEDFTSHMTKYQSTQCQTKMKDVNAELVHRSSQGIIGNELVNSSTQLSTGNKKFKDSSTVTDQLDVDSLIMEVKQFKHRIEIEVKLKQEAADEIKRLNT